MSSIDETTAAATASTIVRPIAEGVTEIKTEAPVVSNPFAGLTATTTASKTTSKEDEGEGDDNEVRCKFLPIDFDFIHLFHFFRKVKLRLQLMFTSNQ